MAPSSLKKMSGSTAWREGSYASSDTSVKGRFLNSDLGLTLLPGLQTRKEDETRWKSATSRVKLFGYDKDEFVRPKVGAAVGEYEEKPTKAALFAKPDKRQEEKSSSHSCAQPKDPLHHQDIEEEATTLLEDNLVAIRLDQDPLHGDIASVQGTGKEPNENDGIPLEHCSPRPKKKKKNAESRVGANSSGQPFHSGYEDLNANQSPEQPLEIAGCECRQVRMSSCDSQRRNRVLLPPIVYGAEKHVKTTYDNASSGISSASTSKTIFPNFEILPATHSSKVPHKNSLSLANSLNLPAKEATVFDSKVSSIEAVVQPSNHTLRHNSLDILNPLQHLTQRLQSPGHTPLDQERNIWYCRKVLRSSTSHFPTKRRLVFTQGSSNRSSSPTPSILPVSQHQQRNDTSSGSTLTHPLQDKVGSKLILQSLSSRNSPPSVLNTSEVSGNLLFCNTSVATQISNDRSLVRSRSVPNLPSSRWRIMNRTRYLPTPPYTNHSLSSDSNTFNSLPMYTPPSPSRSARNGLDEIFNSPYQDDFNEFAKSGLGKNDFRAYPVTNDVQHSFDSPRHQTHYSSRNPIATGQPFETTAVPWVAYQPQGQSNEEPQKTFTPHQVGDFLRNPGLPENLVMDSYTKLANAYKWLKERYQAQARRAVDAERTLADSTRDLTHLQHENVALREQLASQLEKYKDVLSAKHRQANVQPSRAAAVARNILQTHLPLSSNPSNIGVTTFQHGKPSPMPAPLPQPQGAVLQTRAAVCESRRSHMVPDPNPESNNFEPHGNQTLNSQAPHPSAPGPNYPITQARYVDPGLLSQPNGNFFPGLQNEPSAFTEQPAPLMPSWISSQDNPIDLTDESPLPASSFSGGRSILSEADSQGLQAQQDLRSRLNKKELGWLQGAHPTKTQAENEKRRLAQYRSGREAIIRKPQPDPESVAPEVESSTGITPKSKNTTPKKASKSTKDVFAKVAPTEIDEAAKAVEEREAKARYNKNYRAQKKKIEELEKSHGKGTKACDEAVQQLKLVQHRGRKSKKIQVRKANQGTASLPWTDAESSSSPAQSSSPIPESGDDLVDSNLGPHSTNGSRQPRRMDLAHFNNTIEMNPFPTNTPNATRGKVITATQTVTPIKPFMSKPANTISTPQKPTTLVGRPSNLDPLFDDDHNQNRVVPAGGNYMEEDAVMSDAPNDEDDSDDEMGRMLNAAIDEMNKEESAPKGLFDGVSDFNADRVSTKEGLPHVHTTRRGVRTGDITDGVESEED